MRFILWFVRKDILFSRYSLFFGLSCAALFPLMLGWYGYKQTPFLKVDESNLSSALHFLIDFLDLIIIAMCGGVFLISTHVQTEKTNGSFRTLLALPLSREQLFWARVLSALVLGMVPVTFGYLGLWLMRYRGFFSDDPLIALIAKPGFFALLLAFDVLLAAIFVGFSLLADGRIIVILLPVLILGPSLGPRLAKIVLGPMTPGLSQWPAIPEVIKVLSRGSSVVLLTAAVALLVSLAMSMIFKRKKSYL